MRLIVSFALGVCLFCGDIALAQDRAQVRDQVKSRSGYGELRSPGGPDSVQAALRHHDQAKESFYRLHWLENRTQGWYRLKSRLKRCQGLSLGFDFNTLYQYATASLGENDSAGGVFRFYGTWEVLGRGRPWSSEIVFRIEHRHSFGAGVAPQNFGKEIGTLLNTANSFSDFGWGVTNLQWQQWWRGRSVIGFALGRVDLRDWVDSFDLSNWRTALLSAAVTYPTNPLPSAGWGGAIFAHYRKCNTPYVIAGFSDANGHADELGFDTFFDLREYYTFVEAGWTADYDKKDERHARLVYWHQDARRDAGVDEGWGLSFSAGWRFNRAWGPFLRGGIAEGGVIPSKAGLVAGLGIHRRSHDLLGTAIGWARPEDDALRDQVVWETFYRLQISQNWAITPDIEVVFDPSRNPGEDVIVVFGIRMQLAF